MTAATAPTNEIGYQQPYNAYWWLYEPETTPELMWPQSVHVYDQMRRQDAQVISVLNAVTGPVLRTPWRVDPAGAADEVVQFVADDLGLPIVGQDPKPPARSRDRFDWGQHLYEALLMVPLGFSYFEQVYRVDKAGARAHLRKLALRPARTIEYINVAEDGGLESIQQYWIVQGDQRPRPIPVNRLVAYVYRREGGNWLGMSVLRHCYKNWLLKDRLLRVQAQTIERNGMGIPLYVGQEGASPTDLEKGLAMAKAWRSGEAAGTAVPNGADLRLVGVTGTLPDAEPAIRYHDEQIARAVLAHFLNLGTQTGSWALGTTFADFFTLSLQTLAQQVADVATAHVVEDLVDVNFGEDVPAPRICFDEIGSRQAATAAALKSLVDAGIIEPDDVLEQSSRQQYGLPPKDAATVRDQSGGFEEFGPAPAEGEPVPILAAAGGADPKDDGLDDDELVAALIQALAEFTGEVQAKAGPDFNRLHPRDRQGQFRTVVGRILHALAAWSRGEGSDDPLPANVFTREHVRKAALHRGIALKRGASRDEIVDALKDDVRAKRAGEKDAKPATTGKPVRFTLTGGGAKSAEVQKLEAELQGAKEHAGMLRDRAKTIGTGHAVEDAINAQERVKRLEKRLADLRAKQSNLRDLDVGVFSEGGKVSLWEVSDSGERRRRVALVDDLPGLAAWADEHGESELAEWARDREGAPVPVPVPVPAKTAKRSAKKTAPAKAAPAAPQDTAATDLVPTNDVRVVKPPSGARFAVLPKAERGQSGDGRLTPDAPWGRFGAAGVMIRAAGDDGQPRYLLVKAGNRSDTPGRWLLPGGALDELESPYQGAAREIGEELGVGDAQLAGLHPVGEHVADHPSGWTYTSLTAMSPTMFDAHADGVEIAEAGWFTADEMRDMTAQGGKTPARGEIHDRLAEVLPGLTASYRGVDAAEAEARPRMEAARVVSGDLVLGLNIAANHQQTNGTKDPAALRRALDELTTAGGSAVAGLTPDEIARQQVVADALGDLSKLDTPAKLDRKVRAELKKRGVTLDGQMGAFVPFDRHTMDGPADVSAGTPVRITQPSMTYTDPKTKTRTLLSRAQVAAMADPSPARADLDDKLDDLGRRTPRDTAIIDRAAQALANGDDRKQVALQMRRAANADKGMSAEDRRTHELLAGVVGKVERRPSYINDQGNINVDVFVKTDAGRVDLTELEDMEIRPWAEGRAHTYDRDKAKRWGMRYEWVRHELSTGKITRAKAVKLLREQVDIIDQEVHRLERKKKDWSASHDRSKWAMLHYKPSAAEEAALKSGPVAAAAYRDLADKLAAAKIPARPRVGSAPPIELGGVLPLDESTFRYVPLHQAVVSRGQALDPEFKHRGTGPAGGVTYLFGSGFKRPKRAGLTDAENDAIDRYTVGRVARDLNGSLRQGRAVHGTSSHPEIGLSDIDLDVMRTDLDAAIANSQLTRDATLWRGVLLKKADRDRLVPGAVFSDAGYSSTAVSDRGAKKVIDNWRAAGFYKGTTPALYRILARAGTNGAVGHEQAYEVVLPRDQKYRVIREELDADGKTPVFVLEAVQPESLGGITRGRDLLATFDYDSLPKPPGSGFYDRGDHKKAVQRWINEQQGYDGKPTVVTGEELDRAIKRRGAVEMFRGIRDPYDNDKVTAADYAEQFRSGELHFGNGGTMYGAGTYATTLKHEAQSIAGHARGKGAVLRMALRRDARVISYDDVRRLHLKAMPKALRDIDQQREAELATIDTSDAAAEKRIVDKYDALRAKMSGRSQAIADLGNFATLLGYDAIVVPHDRQKVGGHKYYVILNRTALLVEDTDVPL